MTMTTNAENLRQYKSIFSFIAKHMLALVVLGFYFFQGAYFY